MNLERIFSMLKMMTAAGGGATGDSKTLTFDMNAQELRRHLQTLVESAKIEIVNGLYAVAVGKA